MTLTSLTDITEFLKTLDEKKASKEKVTHELKGRFEQPTLSKLFAKHGWYQVDENSMEIRERTQDEQLHLPSRDFVFKDKKRRGTGKYQRPSKFIIVNHELTDLWYASDRLVSMHFEDYMHYHLMTFIRIDEPLEGELPKLPVIMV